jgi:thioredoxin-dependent peroxiredoxin
MAGRPTSEMPRQVADFSVSEQGGLRVRLSSLTQPGPLVLLVHPGVTHAGSVALLMEYRDRVLNFKLHGAHVASISPDEASALAYVRTARGIPFMLLSDPGRTALSALGALGGNGGGEMAVLLLDRARRVRHHERSALGSSDALLTLIKRGIARGRPQIFPRLSAGLRALRDRFTSRRYATRATR